MSDEILTEVKDGVIVITINRPDAKNAMNKAAAEGIAAALDRLEALASCVLAVQGLTADQAAPDCVSLVSSLLESLRECGSVVVQCESVLSADAESDDGARLAALACVRELSRQTELLLPSMAPKYEPDIPYPIQ